MNRSDMKMNIASTQAQTHRGFSLIELMIVVGIIGLLVAISLGVGSGMINSGKKTATTGVLQALDQTLEAYIDSKGEIPPPLVAIDHDDLPRPLRSRVGTDNPGYYPAFDGTTDGGDALVNSIGYYLYSAQDVPSVQEILAGIDPKFIKQYTPSGTGQNGGGVSGAVTAAEQPLLLTVFDAWGNPIRFVHPKFDGIIEAQRRTENSDGNSINISARRNGFFENAPSGGRSMIVYDVRRNKMTEAERDADPKLVADSDGGTCPGARPYFYSAGPDGDPSTTGDNIYTTLPTYIAPF